MESNFENKEVEEKGVGEFHTATTVDADACDSSAKQITKNRATFFNGASPV